MRGLNVKRLQFEIPKDKWGLFTSICHDQNVYPGSVLRTFAEMVIQGKLDVPPGVRKMPLTGVGRPKKPSKRK